MNDVTIQETTHNSKEKKAGTNHRRKKMHRFMELNRKKLYVWEKSLKKQGAITEEVYMSPLNKVWPNVAIT